MQEEQFAATNEVTEPERFSYARWRRARAEIGGADITPSEHVRVYAAAGVLLALFGVFSWYAAPLPTSGSHTASAGDAHVEEKSDQMAGVVPGPDPFAGVKISAASAYVYDVAQDKVLFEKNGETQWPLASITKVMTALVASEHLAKNAVVSVPDTAVATYGESGIGTGARFSFADLLKVTLVASVNDAASALALAVTPTLEGQGTFVDAMNKKAEEIGLAQTYYLNETGLDEGPNVGGGYGSARDVALLYSYIFRTKPEIFDGTDELVTTIADENGLTYTYENTNQTVRSIPGLLGSKTGLTDLSGGNLAIAFDLDFGRPIVVVALGSTEDGRFRDVQALADAARKSFGQQ